MFPDVHHGLPGFLPRIDIDELDAGKEVPFVDEGLAHSGFCQAHQNKQGEKQQGLHVLQCSMEKTPQDTL